MRPKEVRRCPAARQRSGIEHFEPVSEKHDLDAAFVRVVAMAHGVDDRLANSLDRKLAPRRGLRRLRRVARPDPVVDAAHDEIQGLVDLLEHCAAIDVVGRERLLEGSPPKLKTLDFP